MQTTKNFNSPFEKLGNSSSFPGGSQFLVSESGALIPIERALQISRRNNEQFSILFEFCDRTFKNMEILILVASMF